jgi:tetratricopeptide (TPR) repeat protein
MRLSHLRTDPYLLVVGAMALLPPAATHAQHQPTAEAEQFFRQGEAAAPRPKRTTAANWAAAASKFRHAVELDPEFIDAHNKYVNAVYSRAFALASRGEQDAPKKAAEKLTAQYQAWLRLQPNEPGFEWGLGNVYASFYIQDWSAARSHFRCCVDIAPDFAPCWNRLGYVTQRQGNSDAALSYFERATKAWPDSPEYALSYAFPWRERDQTRYKELLRAIVIRFPRTPEETHALYELATLADTLQNKIVLLERMMAEAPPPQNHLTEPLLLFRAYLLSDQDKAAKLAEHLKHRATNSGIRHFWSNYEQMVEKLTAAESKVKENNGDAALGLIGRAMSLERHSLRGEDVTDMRPFVAVSGQAATKAHDTGRGYALLSRIEAVAPGDAELAVLHDLGERLGKTHGQVDDDLWQLRTANAPLMKEFELTDSAGNKVKLADYLGHPVVVDFWYPT